MYAPFLPNLSTAGSAKNPRHRLGACAIQADITSSLNMRFLRIWWVFARIEAGFAGCVSLSRRTHYVIAKLSLFGRSSLLYASHLLVARRRRRSLTLHRRLPRAVKTSRQLPQPASPELCVCRLDPQRGVDHVYLGGGRGGLWITRVDGIGDGCMLDSSLLGEGSQPILVRSRHADGHIQEAIEKPQQLREERIARCARDRQMKAKILGNSVLAGFAGAVDLGERAVGGGHLIPLPSLRCQKGYLGIQTATQLDGVQ